MKKRLNELATQDFLLAPGMQWPRDISLQRREEIVEEWLDSTTDSKELVRTLNDGELRQTPYWQAAIYHLCNARGWECSICGCELYEPNGEPKGELHRLSLDSYGREFLPISRYERDFVPMCKSCYARIQKEFADLFARDKEEIQNLVNHYKKN